MLHLKKGKIEEISTEFAHIEATEAEMAAEIFWLLVAHLILRFPEPDDVFVHCL